jgi:hypothetical protein
MAHNFINTISHSGYSPSFLAHFFHRWVVIQPEQLVVCRQATPKIGVLCTGESSTVRAILEQ